MSLQVGQVNDNMLRKARVLHEHLMGPPMLGVPACLPTVRDFGAV